MRKADLTLEKEIGICCASENVTNQVRVLAVEVEVNRIITVTQKDNKIKANTINPEQK